MVEAFWSRVDGRGRIVGVAVGSGGVRDAAVGLREFLVVGCQGVFVACGISDSDVDLAGIIERLDFVGIRPELPQRAFNGRGGMLASTVTALGRVNKSLSSLGVIAALVT